MVKQPEIRQESIAAALEKILSSETMRGKEPLRVLLTYLVEKTLDGTAESLKEYTIGVEAFGKPASYNPQEDASVRVQIGRLRQKLEEYYRTEGAHDSFVIELPKRQFALLFHEQPEAAITEPPSEAVPADAPPTVAPVVRPFSWPSLLLGAFVVALLWGGWSFLKPRELVCSSAAAATSPELLELWCPFLLSERPVTKQGVSFA